MAITKRSNNSGMMANPGGVSKLDLRAQIATANKELMSNYKGHLSFCQCCNNNYHLNADEYTLEESLILDQWLAKKGCPHCDWKNPQIFKLRKLLVEHKFVIGAREYECLRVPQGYRPRTIKNFDEETQSMPTSKKSESGIKIYSYDSKGNQLITE